MLDVKPVGSKFHLNVIQQNNIFMIYTIPIMFYHIKYMYYLA